MMNQMLTLVERQSQSVCCQLKRFWKKTLILVLFTALGSLDLSAQTITIDGNPIDWNSSNFNLFLTKKYQGDAFGNGVVDNQFTEGSKDFFYANQLVWSISQTKAKNDIANGAAVLQNGILYFAGDRVSNNGDAQIGFWLYLNGTGPTTVNGVNTFSPPHADGDVLVLADFTGGGRNATVTIYQWDASGNGNVPNTNGNLRTTNLTGTVAENNAGQYPIPTGWSFSSTTYDYNMFYEGRVDLTQLNIPSLCNASFLLETRSSQSITASLDDFVGGTFNATPLPLVLSGSAFCSPAFSSGTITSTTSEAGFSYQLYNSSNVAVGSPKIGTGSGLTWTGIPAGSGYYVVGAGQVNCTSNSNTVDVSQKQASSSTQSRAICNNQLPYTWDGLTFTEAGTKTKTGLTNAAGCDSTATYTITVKLTSSSQQSRAICNNQLPYTWDGLTFTEAGTKTKTGLTNAAGCDSTATYTITVKLTSSSTQSRAICNNQLPYTWDGLTFTEAGTKTKTGLTNAAGCDSTATYTITVKLTSSSQQSRAICNNQLPYTWDGLTFTEAGTKTKTGLTNAAGCDSTATYTITVKLTSSSTQSRAICNNQLPYTWDGLTFTEAGTKTKTGLTNAAGCDSTATYTITVKLTSSSTQSRAICNNQLPYTWDGLTFTEAGTKTKTGLTNAAGCDSTATYTITVKLTSSSTQSRAICNNQLPYTWDGLTFTEAGTKTKTGLTNAAGCDSTATYTITVKLTSSSTQSRAICNNQLPYTWDGLTFTEAGTKTKTGLTNAAGCDSTATYTITVKLTTASQQSRAICNNQLPYTWDGLTFTEAGTKTKTGLTNAAGCDSTATYTITVKLTSSSTQSRAICNNQLPYTWDGLTFTEAGTKTKTGLTNAAGCDSTATYTITVKQTSSSTQSRAICNNQLPYTWDGLTFTEAGTKTKTGLTNAAGCDSTATYTITVKLTSSSQQSRAICNNQLPYTWDGLTFTEAGTKTKTGLTNAAGCDSTATYTISVKLTSSSQQSRAICNNQLPYTWDGLTFTEAGTKTKTGLTNAAGCDSTATYTITVKLTSSSTQSRAICNNQLPYTWDGLTFTEAGTKTKTGLTNAAGCDSTATYTITVKLTSSSQQSRAICNNQLPYTWDGLTFTEAGTKTKTGLTNAAGCDSTATYTITVKLTSSSTQSRAICNNQLPYTWDGLTFTEAGTKTKTGLTNAAGCDSTATYTITVKLTSSSTQSRAICNNQLPYTWDGLTFTEAGTKTKTGLTNAAGCDSTATYTITVKLTSSSSQSMSVCTSALPFTWDGLTFTEAGTQTKTGLTNAAGCDSTAAYTLSLYPNPDCSIVGGTIGGGPLCVGGGLPAPAPIYSGPAGMAQYKWTVSGNISIKDGIDNQQTVTIIVTGNGTLTLEVTNEFGCTSTCSKQIQVQQNAPCNLTGPEKVCTNSTNTYSTAAVDGATYNWSVDGDATILSSMPYGNSIQVKAGGVGSYTVHLTIEKPEACPSACEWTTDVENCAKPYCTYTQGYYGNSGGKACTPQGTKTTLQLITNSISNMPGSVLYLGKPGRSFTATVADASRIIIIMPGGGSPTTLPAGNWTANSLPVSKQGRINNVLLSQTIALALNVYMGGSTLGELSLADAGGKYMITVARKDGTCGTLSTDAAECKFKPVYGIDGVTIVGYTTSYNPYKATYFSSAIVNALGGSKTVKDLLALASAVLGGAPLPAGVSYSSLSDAVASINEVFDECKLFVTFSSTSNVSGLCTPPVIVTPTGTKMRPVVQADVTNQINITAYPNPFKGQLNFRFVSPASGRATLEVFNIFGQKLETVFDGDVTKDRSYFATFRKSLNGQNMIIYKLTVGGKVVTGKVQSME